MVSLYSICVVVVTLTSSIRTQVALVGPPGTSTTNGDLCRTQCQSVYNFYGRFIEEAIMRQYLVKCLYNCPVAASSTTETTPTTKTSTSTTTTPTTSTSTSMTTTPTTRTSTSTTTTPTTRISTSTTTTPTTITSTSTTTTPTTKTSTTTTPITRISTSTTTTPTTKASYSTTTTPTTRTSTSTTTTPTTRTITSTTTTSTTRTSTSTTTTPTTRTSTSTTTTPTTSTSTTTTTTPTTSTSTSKTTTPTTTSTSTPTTTTPTTTSTSTPTTTTPTTTSTSTSKTTTLTTTSTPTTPSNQECGVSLAYRKKVIGGADAAECQFPWVAHVTGENDGQIYCGASIIDSRHVITAAHCLRNRRTGQIASPSMVNVSVGSSDRTRLTTVQVLAIILDPRYNSATKDYDTAVLRLGNELTFSDCIRPICLPSVTDDPAAADFCEVAGWGLTIYNNITSEATILQHVALPLVDQQRCQNSYFIGPETINELKLCAGDYYQGGLDTCSGDSGGPLMCLSKGRYFLYGVTSFGKYCGFRYYPGVYARVNHPSILDFINSARSS